MILSPPPAMPPPDLPLHDYEPDTTTFRAEVLAGLRQSRKTLPCKFFYDERGSQLFDQICELPEYYPTRTESAIMETYGPEMAAALGPQCLLVEYGSGSSLKTRILLDHLTDPAGYVPIDISREHLLRSAASLAAGYPGLRVLPVCADYTRPFDLPTAGTEGRPVVYFPGSTIGNFHREQAETFLQEIAGVCGTNGGLLIGVDLKKSPQVLEPAYNDAKGITAAFNLNLLERINAELDGDFDLGQWEHHAFYNPFIGRIEMHLISLQNQQVHLGGVPVCFDADETIHTECSYKYSLDEFASMAECAGLRVEQVWTDPQNWFSVQYLTVC